LKIKAHWYARPYPHDWEFYAECDEGSNVDIAVKNDPDIKKIGPNPKEIVLQGMATCTSVDVVSSLNKMRQPLHSLVVECEAKQTETHPKVFKECIMTYKVTGENLNIERVTHCVQLSFTKYCGVSAMIEKSGCHVTPKLFVNEREVPIWDPEESISNKLKKWLQEIASHQPRGIVLITGSSRGIGAALVNYFAEKGFAVLPTSRNKVIFDNKNIFESLYLDVSKLGSILNLKNLLQKNGVKLNLIIQNAGISSIDPNADDLNALNLTMADLRHVYETNVFGLIETNNIFMELMNKDGTIAFMSSTIGQVARDSYLNASYRLTKRSVIQFAKQAALQLKAENKEIVMLSIHPGSVKTELNPNGKISVEQSAKNMELLFAPDFREKLIQNNGSFWIFDESDHLWKCVE